MQCNNFKKFMVTGMASVLCAGGMSIANIPSYNGDYLTTAFADTIKDTDLTATGTIKSNVFVRKGPGTSYDKITVLTKDTKVDIVGKSSNAWYKIKYNTGYAYVYSEYVTLTDGDTDTKVDSDIAYSATGTTTGNLNVRKAASTSAAKLATLQKGTSVSIVAKTADGSWYKIKYGSGYGYVSAQYVNTKSTPQVPSQDDKDIAYSATGTTTENLNVRKAASTSAAKLATLQKGTSVSIVAKTADGSWYKIKYGSGYGYVSAQYVTLTSSEKPEVQYPVTGVANHAVYVRKAGSPTADKLGTLAKDAKVTVLAEVQYHWYKIQYKDGVGYVYGEYLDIQTQK